MRLGFRLVIQARAVDKVGVLHAQLHGPLVHPFHKGRLAAGHGFGQGCGAVVGRGDHHGFEHLVHGHLLALFQIDLAAALGCGGSAGRHRLVPGQPPLVQRLHDQQQRHDLGDAGGPQAFVAVLFIEDLPRGRVHQNGRRRRHLRPGGPDRRQQGDRQAKACQGPAQSFPHIHPSFLFTSVVQPMRVPWQV